MAARLTLALLATILTLELPVRWLHGIVQARTRTGAVLAGARPPEFRQKLIEDYLDPATRLRYEYDMFVGWRALPNQRGHTYELNAQGRRDSVDYDRLASRVVAVTGGSAAWSLGASNNDRTLTAFLEQFLRAPERVPASQLQVVNLAEQAYGLRQEATTVLDFVSEHRPDLVIFYDGVNDLHTIANGRDPFQYRTWSEFPAVLKTALREATSSRYVWTSSDLLASSMTVKLTRRAVSAARQLIGGRDGVPDEGVSEVQAEQIRRFFSREIPRITRVLAGQGVEALFVLQPTGYLHKPPAEQESFLRSPPRWWIEAYEIADDVYRSLNSRDGVETHSLIRVFEDESRQVYLDPTHMNDLGNEIVARELARVIRARYEGLN